MKNRAHLLIGSNMGDREAFLLQAGKGIEQAVGAISKHSAIYQTAAWGIEDQAPFLNQVVEIETRLPPVELLQIILGIEEALGRRRAVKYGPRLIDIDILFFNDEVIATDGLTVPHPQLQHRRFVLEPLAEIAPEYVHPLLQKTVTQLLQECADPLPVQKFQ